PTNPTAPSFSRSVRLSPDSRLENGATRTRATISLVEDNFIQGPQHSLPPRALSCACGELTVAKTCDWLFDWVLDEREQRRRTIDVHALRHTVGTMLSKGGVLPRTAQATMRHSDVNLTMNVYTDPKLLDVAGALDSLPALPLARIVQSESSGGEVASENR